ncbi:MAG: AGE family epimerase/isomerase [Chthonomonadetes bacterium]|nr:AGE family epimerase/isomerase [Chthonomonadetes bacterium]
MYRQFAEEALERIEGTLRISNSPMYRERMPRADLPYATLWPLSMLQSALIAGAEREPKRYLPRLESLQQTLLAYWDDKHQPPGFDAYPKGNDKYYDDNAWMVLNYLRLHALTHDRKWLRWAQQVHRFVWSGWDEQLGGGIYWHQSRKSKNTCSNAPALVSALWLYAVTKDAEYLSQAERLHAWLTTHLQDPEDGLFWDNIQMDGRVDRAKFPYNTALMIDANLWWYRLKRGEQFLREAERLARASQKHWLGWQSRAIEGFAPFVVKLCEAYRHLAQVADDSRWVVLVERTAEFVRTLRSPEGDYPEDWQGGEKKDPVTSLMALASSACLFWLASTS